MAPEELTFQPPPPLGDPRLNAAGLSMLHWSGGICALIDSNDDQPVQPNSDRYHPCTQTHPSTHERTLPLHVYAMHVLTLPRALLRFSLRRTRMHCRARPLLLAGAISHYTCLHTCLHTCLYTCLYICLYTCLYTFRCAFLYARLVYTHIYTNTWTHALHLFAGAHVLWHRRWA